MSKEKSMEVKKVSKVSKIKLNVNFIDFISRVMKEKLLSKNVEELKELYLSDVKVKSSVNVLRVSDRVKRDKLRNVLEKVLKEKGISFDEFDKVSNEVVSVLREKKGSNYIEV